jgi:arylsulfatase A-like enzyme
VPLIVEWPGVIERGSRTSAMTSWIDLLPTLIEAAGGIAPKDIDGRSFLPVLLGKRSEHRDRIFTTHSGDGQFNVYPMRSVRTAGWSYILNLHPDYAFTTHIDLPVNLGQRAYFATWEAAAETNAQAAHIVKRYHQRPAEELYDLKADPDQQHNLASEPRQASRLKEMRGELEAWMREQRDKRVVYNKPRLLSDPASYGPDARMRETSPKPEAVKAKAKAASDAPGNLPDSEK